MAEIFLARHGQDEDNVNRILNGHRDMPLTDLGIQQAHDLAENIFAANLLINRVYSSPLQRAYKTAQIVAERIGVEEVNKHDDLIERHFGDMQGQKLEEVSTFCGGELLQSDTILYCINPKNGENFDQAYIRAQKLLDYFVNNYKGEKVLLFTHGDIGKMIYAAYYKLNWRDVLLNFHFGNADLLELSPNSSAETSHLFEQKQHNW